jgi:hypothetical protein
MPADTPSPRARTHSGCVLILSALGVVMVVAGLMVWAFGWMDDRTPWAGRGVLIILVVGAGIRIVGGLLAPPRSRSNVLAAGGVVALAGVALYFGVVRPALRDRERDAQFAARLAEQRAQADALEAVGRELPDPAAINPADIPAARRRAADLLARVPDVDPDSIGPDEYDRYTARQKAELGKEVARASAALKAIHDRHAALLAVLDQKKDHPK